METWSAPTFASVPSTRSRCRLPCAEGQPPRLAVPVALLQECRGRRLPGNCQGEVGAQDGGQRRASPRPLLSFLVFPRSASVHVHLGREWATRCSVVSRNYPRPSTRRPRVATLRQMTDEWRRGGCLQTHNGTIQGSGSEKHVFKGLRRCPLRGPAGQTLAALRGERDRR